MIWNKKPLDNSDKILAIWIFLLGFHALSFYLGIKEYVKFHTHLLDFNSAFPLSQCAFLYLYTSTIINPEKRFKKHLLLHFVPFISFAIYLTFFNSYHNSNPGVNYYFNIVFLRNDSLIISFFNFITLFSIPVYAVLTHYLLHKHSKTIKKFFSSTESISLNWLRYILLGLGVVWITLIVLHSITYHHQGILNERQINLYVFVSITIFVLITGFFGLRQNLIYKPVVAKNEVPNVLPVMEKETEPLEKKYKFSGLKEVDVNKILADLLQYMENEKPFLNSEISLPDLANQMNLSSNYLSQVINENLRKNFYDFINEYRIAEFKSRITNPKYHNFTILAIALDCGFNSKSSFNRIFKNLTGKTPTEYKKEIITQNADN